MGRGYDDHEACAVKKEKRKEVNVTNYLLGIAPGEIGIIKPSSG
jgi:hypothetical protein